MDSTHKIMLTTAAIDAATEAVNGEWEWTPDWEYAVTFLQAALPHLRVVKTDTRSRHTDDRQPYPNLLPVAGYKGLETDSVKIRVPYTGDTPRRGYPTDAGADLRIKEDLDLPPGEYAKVALTTRVNIPPGYMGLLVPRSSTGALGIVSHPGIIDAGYTGEIAAILHNQADYTIHLKSGGRVMQIIIVPTPPTDYVRVTHLGDTDRGDGGFGSTGTGNQE